MTFQLDPARRERMITALQGFYLGEFEEDLSAFRAEQLLDFALSLVGPELYNQAVQDARGWLQGKLDDLEGEIFFPGSP